MLGGVAVDYVQSLRIHEAKSKWTENVMWGDNVAPPGGARRLFPQ